MQNLNLAGRRKGEIDPVDAHVGARLRMRRALVGMSQEQLGATVGISFQQVQKYERGMNRMGASRLYQFARALRIPVSYFFDGLDGHESQKLAATEEDKIYSRETLTLVRAYYAVSDKKQREKIMSLIKTMAAQ